MNEQVINNQIQQKSSEKSSELNECEDKVNTNAQINNDNNNIKSSNYENNEIQIQINSNEIAMIIKEKIQNQQENFLDSNKLMKLQKGFMERDSYISHLENKSQQLHYNNIKFNEQNNLLKNQNSLLKDQNHQSQTDIKEISQNLLKQNEIIKFYQQETLQKQNEIQILSQSINILNQKLQDYDQERQYQLIEYENEVEQLFSSIQVLKQELQNLTEQKINFEEYEIQINEANQIYQRISLDLDQITEFCTGLFQQNDQQSQQNVLNDQQNTKEKQYEQQQQLQFQTLEQAANIEKKLQILNDVCINFNFHVLKQEQFIEQLKIKNNQLNSIKDESEQNINQILQKNLSDQQIQQQLIEQLKKQILNLENELQNKENENQKTLQNVKLEQQQQQIEQQKTEKLQQIVVLDLQNQLKLQQNQLEEWKNNAIVQESEKQVLQIDLSKQQSELREKQNQNDNFSSEIKQLQEINQLQILQNETLNKIIVELQQTRNQIQEKSSQNKTKSEKEIQEIKINLENLKIQIEQFKIKEKDYNQEICQLIQQNSIQQQLFQEKQTEFTKQNKILKEKNLQQQHDLDSLQKQQIENKNNEKNLKDIETQILNLKQSNFEDSNLKIKQIQNLKEQLQQKQNQLEKQQDEVQLIQRQEIILNQEIQQLKREKNQFLEIQQFSNNKIDDLIQQIEKLKTEIQEEKNNKAYNAKEKQNINQAIKPNSQKNKDRKLSPDKNQDIKQFKLETNKYKFLDLKNVFQESFDKYNINKQNKNQSSHNINQKKVDSKQIQLNNKNEQNSIFQNQLTEKQQFINTNKYENKQKDNKEYNFKSADFKKQFCVTERNSKKNEIMFTPPIKTEETVQQFTTEQSPLANVFQHQTKLINQLYTSNQSTGNTLQNAIKQNKSDIKENSLEDLQIKFNNISELKQKTNKLHKRTKTNIVNQSDSPSKKFQNQQKYNNLESMYKECIQRSKQILNKNQKFIKNLSINLQKDDSPILLNSITPVQAQKTQYQQQGSGVKEGIHHSRTLSNPINSFLFSQQKSATNREAKQISLNSIVNKSPDKYQKQYNKKQPQTQIALKRQTNNGQNDVQIDKSHQSQQLIDVRDSYDLYFGDLSQNLNSSKNNNNNNIQEYAFLTSNNSEDKKEKEKNNPQQQNSPIAIFDLEQQSRNFMYGNQKNFYSNKDVYEGNFLLNKRQGHGVLRNQQGKKIYQGEWENDNFHGTGILYNVNNLQSNNNNIKILFSYKNLSDYLSSNYWSSYQGEFNNGQFSGIGSLQFINGEKFIGSFKNGEIHGEGSYYKQNQEKIYGQWKNNVYLGTKLTQK